MSFVSDGGKDVHQSFEGDRSRHGEENENFKVVVRVRPPLPRELHGERPFVEIVQVQKEHSDAEYGKMVTISEHLEGEEGSRGILTSQVLSFDTVYDQTSTQKTLYENTAKQAVLSVLEGYNATMIAYGQTGTGKTYTMEGFTSDHHRGIIPRATEEIFNFISTCGNSRTRFLVRASYLQIYNEVISDLIKPNPNAKLVIREDKQKGVYVEGLSEWIVRSPQEIYGLMDMGSKMRATGATKMSEMSSRSHAIFTIICEQGEESGEDEKVCVKIGKLNIVDLAGSEKVRQTGATGQRLEESKKINLSLSALGNVISALTDSHSRHHVPYRDSKLTRILEDSLGGNCKTTMIAMISPAIDSYSESLSTLKFANRAKHIKNEAKINEDLDQKAELRKYERELKVLRHALSEANRSMAESRRALDSQEQKRALEREKITELERMMLMGGQEIEDHPAFQEAIQRVNDKYNAKMEALDKERQAIEEDKAQVDRYKQLLLKQRDIMIALTARLNERDECILGLQEELDAYDARQGELEEALAAKTAAPAELQPPFLEPLSAVMIPTAAGIDLQSLRRTLPDGTLCYLSEDARRGSSTPVVGAESQAWLTPDQKIAELYSCLHRPSPLHPSCGPATGDREAELARRLHEALQDKASVEYMLKERLERMVQVEIADRLSSYKREVEEWSLKYSALEEKRRAAEHLLELHRGGGMADPNDGVAHVKSLLVTESEHIKRPYLEKIANLNSELQASERDRHLLLKEVDTVTFKMHQFRAQVAAMRQDPADGDLDTLWTIVHSISSDGPPKGHRRLGTQGDGRLPLDDLSNRPKVPSAKSEDVAHTVRHYEQKIEALKSQVEGAQQEAERRLRDQANDLRAAGQEVAELQQKLAHHSQERKALRIIMEEKIKKRIDTIDQLFHEYTRNNNAQAATAGPHGQCPDLTAQRKKLEDQIKGLQTLLTAAIRAMGDSTKH